MAPEGQAREVDIALEDGAVELPVDGRQPARARAGLSDGGGDALRESWINMIAACVDPCGCG